MLSPHQSLYEIFHLKDIQTMWKYVSFLLFIEYVHTYTDPFVQIKRELPMENHGSFQQKNSIDFFVSSYNFLIRQYNPVYKGLAVFLFSQIHRATEPYPYIFALSRCIFRCKPCNKTSHFHICSCFRSMSVQIQRDCDTWMSMMYCRFFGFIFFCASLVCE